MKYNFFLHPFLLFLIITSLPALAEESVCNECSVSKELNVCFVSKRIQKDGKQAIAQARRKCGNASQIYWIKNINTFNKHYPLSDSLEGKFKSLSRGCNKIKNLSFYGFGFNNIPEAKTRKGENILRQYSCLMAKNANVKTLGHDPIRPCYRDVQALNIAKNLFHDKKGTVLSSQNSYFSLFSRNGTFRTLSYDPQKTNPAQWRKKLLIRTSKGKSLEEVCEKNLKGVLDKLARLKRKSTKCYQDNLIPHFEKAIRLGKRNLTKISSDGTIRTAEGKKDITFIIAAIGSMTHNVKRCQSKNKSKRKKRSSSRTFSFPGR